MDYVLSVMRTRRTTLRSEFVAIDVHSLNDSGILNRILQRCGCQGDGRLRPLPALFGSYPEDVPYSEAENYSLVGRIRSALFEEGIPDLISMENVAGPRQVQEHLIRLLVTCWTDLGYKWCDYDILSCADYGVPQNRKASGTGGIPIGRNFSSESNEGRTTICR